jgi:hypothetical protein
MLGRVAGTKHMCAAERKELDRQCENAAQSVRGNSARDAVCGSRHEGGGDV